MKSKVKSGGSSHHDEPIESSSHRHRSNVESRLPSQSPTSVNKKPEATPRKSRHSRRAPSVHKKTPKKKERDNKLKSPSPNAVALASSQIPESPRSITPPKRGLSDDGLLEGTRSFHGEESDVDVASRGARASLANLFKLDDSPKVIKTTKPLWMKGSMAWDSSHTTTRQRMAPPPESPQAGKARLMVHQRKLERSNSHDGMLGGPDVGDVVQRRRKKHFDKCAKASIQIQRIARGWLVRNCLHPNKNNKRKGHEHKEHKRTHHRDKHHHHATDKEVKKPSKEKEERDLCLSPERLIDDPSLDEPAMTPIQKAMRLSLRRLGASEKRLAEKLYASEKDLFSNSFSSLSSSFARKPSDADVLLYQSKDDEDDEEADLEINLCNMFKSNIATATARARRRSFKGEMSDSFANMEGIL